MKSKKLKLLASTLILVFVLLASCKNNDTFVGADNTTKSVSAKTSMEVLKTHFNDDGTLNDANNPVGNILFDFCFEFVYPVTLSYNNGTEVEIQNFNDLIEVLINMTDTLFINGIAFPFDVEVVENGAVVIRTINSEAEFRTLIEGCAIGGDDSCVCTEEYDPVCVEIQTPDNGSFTMQFPNMCFAECEGFTQDDVVDCDNNHPPGGNFNDCFQFVFPFTIIDDTGTAIEINNDDEFQVALFSTVSYEFVFPLSVTQEINGQTETIVLENNESLVQLLISCVTQSCNCPTVYDPVCVASPNGGIVEYENSCLAICAGFTPNDFVTCN
ncbi:MAG TPA: hypothetical protein ENK46_08350 [Flavobacteriia bacterium]|nr:hypothetical protein [Flavobacteriia bacterium]